MSFYAGDNYNFILNIPNIDGNVAVTTPPTITILDITDPGSPIVSGAAMTTVSGTAFVYFYPFTIPNNSPKDYIALYSYSISDTDSVGTANSAIWRNGKATFNFNIPLQPNTTVGDKLTTTGFTASGFNVTNASITDVRNDGSVSVAVVSNPTSSQSFSLSGNAQIVAGFQNLATMQLTQITSGSIIPGDTLTITGATNSALNGTALIQTASLLGSVWTVTFVTSGTPFSSTAQTAGTAVNPVGVATVLGTGVTISIQTISNQVISLKDELHVGDSNITGQVALQSTVALNATVAKDATVFKATSYVTPSNDPLVQQIATAATAIQADTDGLVALTGSLGSGTLAGLIQDLYDAAYGGISIDQTQNPPVMSIKRINGTVIATFQLVNNNTATQRVVLSSPAESSI